MIFHLKNKYILQASGSQENTLIHASWIARKAVDGTIVFPVEE